MSTLIPSSVTLWLLLLLPTPSAAQSDQAHAPDAQQVDTQRDAKPKATPTTKATQDKNQDKTTFDPVEELLESFAIFMMGYLLLVCKKGFLSFLQMSSDYKAFEKNLPFRLVKVKWDHNKSSYVPTEALKKILSGPYPYLRLGLACGLSESFSGIIFGLVLVLCTRLSLVDSWLSSLGASLKWWKESKGFENKFGARELTIPLLVWTTVMFIGSLVIYGLVYLITFDKKIAMQQANTADWWITVVSTLFLLYYIYYTRYTRSLTAKEAQKSDASKATQDAEKDKAVEKP